VTVGVKVDYFYPQWQTPEDYQVGLLEKWQSYIANLEIHEEGHGQNGIDAGQDILNALSALPDQATCDAASSLAVTTANNVVSKYNTKDEDYDDSTGHGRTQGAVFP
jgi:predicted secreted Zn-dependent protease